MTITNGYATVTQVRQSFNTHDGEDDAQFEVAIEAASRWIDKLCGRRFYVDSSATARVFDAESGYCVRVHDISTSVGFVLKTDPGDTGTFSETWSATDYQLRPLNGLGPAGQAWPYTEIRAVLGRTFPLGRLANVQVTAKWGWAAVPADVALACVRLAQFTFRSKDAPLGIAEFADLAALRARTPSIVLDLLAGFQGGTAYASPMLG